MRRTSCPSVEISSRSDSGGERQPTEKRIKRQNAPARIKRTSAWEMTEVLKWFVSSYPLPDLPGGGATLFLIGVDRVCYGIAKRTWHYLPDTAVSSKMGDFNTPSVNPIFKRKTAVWNWYFKTTVDFLSRKIVIEWRFCVLIKSKKPIIRAQWLRVIGSASLRLALW